MSQPLALVSCAQGAGFGPADDRIPEWMTEEPLPLHGSVFDVEDAELDGVAKWS